MKNFFVSQGRSVGDFKKIFDNSMRSTLDNGQPALYDISLLYKLLRNVCGLSTNDNDWVCQGPLLIESNIQHIKQERNCISHANQIIDLTDQQIQNKLNILESCISILLTDINIPRQRATVLQDEIQIDFKDLMLKEDWEISCRDELKNYYPTIYNVALAGWLYPDLKIRPSLNYTSLVIKEDQSNLPAHDHEMVRTVPHQELLQICHRNNKEPNIILLYGEGGIGKSTTLQYITEMWVNDLSKILTLDTYPLLLFYQLRGTNISSWRELIEHLLWDTYQSSGVTLEFFTNVLRDMKALVLLDGFDEAGAESVKLVKDLINLRSKLRLVITTRPASLGHLSVLVSRENKVVLSIEIRGVTNDKREELVHNTVLHLESDQSQQQVKPSTEGLDVPLTLTLVVLRRMGLSPGEEPEQNLYQDLTDMMVGKGAERLEALGVSDANRKLNKFLFFLSRTAHQTWDSVEHDISDETFEMLKQECEKLNLPHREVLSGFLLSKRSLRGMQMTETWSFPHRNFQKQWAVMYAVKMGINIDMLLTQVQTQNAPRQLSNQELLVASDSDAPRSISTQDTM